MTALLTATTAVPIAEKVTVPLLVALLGLTGVIITALVGLIGGRWAQAINRRRDAYAAAVKTLVALAEYPYRIRRRTSDEPDELARLVGIGHDLQEQLRCHQTWIITETAPASRAAWTFEPIKMLARA